mmetsp:Transcript_14749/g.30865  ORF Transcript_14749/g.30865 Transcript_14749/m.30865 type:complete len:257 (+) Transcript_14749:390-1160(+)
MVNCGAAAREEPLVGGDLDPAYIGLSIRDELHLVLWILLEKGLLEVLKRQLGPTLTNDSPMLVHPQCDNHFDAKLNRDGHAPPAYVEGRTACIYKVLHLDQVLRTTEPSHILQLRVQVQDHASHTSAFDRLFILRVVRKSFKAVDDALLACAFLVCHCPLLHVSMCDTVHRVHADDLLNPFPSFICPFEIPLDVLIVPHAHVWDEVHLNNWATKLRPSDVGNYTLQSMGEDQVRPLRLHYGLHLLGRLLDAFLAEE